MSRTAHDMKVNFLCSAEQLLKKIKSHCVSINQGELKIDWIISCHWQFHKCICSKENCRQCWWCPSWPSFTSCLVDNPKLESTFNINTLFEIFIFCPKIQLWFPEKIVDFFGWKTRENVVVLDFSAFDNFNFTKKMSKIF